MPTARELLQQADALMRRNRGGGDDIPVLTDVVAEPAPAELTPNAEPPLLTDAVEELMVDLAPLSEGRAEGEPSLWLGPDSVDPSLHSITGPAPDTLGVVPAMTAKAAGSAPTPPPARSAPVELHAVPSTTEPTADSGSEVAPPGAAVAAPAMSAPPEDEERWRALAEQISMQVLQRIDLFTDTGLKEQLAQHLQPIVERASSELVGAINQQVGHLVRTYVAEAIEREIAEWRRGHE